MLRFYTLPQAGAAMLRLTNYVSVFGMMVLIKNTRLRSVWQPTILPPLLMAFTPDAQYMEGNWKLIPRPIQDVKAEIERGIEKHGLRGFQGRDDSAPLSDMEYYWVAVSLMHR